jgi:hypothetical protein
MVSAVVFGWSFCDCADLALAGWRPGATNACGGFGAEEGYLPAEVERCAIGIDYSRRVREIEIGEPVQSSHAGRRGTIEGRTDVVQHKAAAPRMARVAGAALVNNGAGQ